MRRLLIAAALAIPLAAGAAAPTTTQAAALPQAATCSGVWVVVDFGSLGGTSTKCAPSGGFGTGVKALKSAGFSVALDSGFVLKVNGKPSNPDPNTAYWSYWHATAKDDGTWSRWSYSNLGADSYRPVKGEAEGWHYLKLSDAAAGPGEYPPLTATSSPSPEPTATKTTAKPSATAKPTKTASASATATRTGTTKKTATRSPTASRTQSPTPASPTPTATQASPLGADEATEVAQVQDTGAVQDTGGGGGSPTGLIVAGVLIVLAGGGLAGWWLRRGRRP